MWLQDPKTKQPSVTLTLMTVGFVICMIKLLLAGNIFGKFTFGEFSGVDFGAVMASLVTIYGYRKTTDANKKPEA